MDWGAGKIMITSVGIPGAQGKSQALSSSRDEVDRRNARGGRLGVKHVKDRRN